MQQYCNKDYFLTCIAVEKLGTESHTLKQFLYSFPRLPKNASEAQICDFYHRVVCHCTGYSVCVPPFATQNDKSCTGDWYPDLPAHCHARWGYYDQCLQQALVSSSAGLADTELTKSLVSEFSGYNIMWNLAY